MASATSAMPSISGRGENRPMIMASANPGIRAIAIPIRSGWFLMARRA
jgi:hypothetical protein